ncbi:unnamed protein product, partial [Mesorhabditis spiculigera]
MSGTVNTLLQDLGFDDAETGDSAPIPLPNVDAVTLEKVLKWCEYHKNDAPVVEADDIRSRRTDDITPWDQEYLKVDQGTLFHIILASNYLDIKGLLDLCCKTVANMVKGKKVKEIRTLFNIKNDWTEEEEAQIIRENSWCED